MISCAKSCFNGSFTVVFALFSFLFFYLQVHILKIAIFVSSAATSRVATTTTTAIYHTELLTSIQFLLLDIHVPMYRIMMSLRYATTVFLVHLWEMCNFIGVFCYNVQPFIYPWILHVMA